MVTKKIRSEYMKKFRDPKWETFSKCYEDSLKYRLTRRVMEHSHKPWFWEGWDGGSESSGRSTPRPTGNRIAPLSLPPAAAEETRGSPGNGSKPPAEDGRAEVRGGDAVVVDAAATAENGVSEAASGPSEETDGGPADTSSSDGEPAVPAVPAPKRRPRRRDASHDDKPAGGAAAAVRKTPRAKSQPPIGTKEKENRRPSGRPASEVRRTPNPSSMSDACVQTRRDSDKRSSDVERRRARSADLEKTRRLTVADDRWVTEYMRCFSARLR
ncbi:centriole, cilia and spindle-associated protein [Cyclopterus lumpus]|uniref:centriole, cilia and spindle-associated protein n=1 Tax=Cyclopterus lumpus TaxID=8103 RepID=UPI00148647DD|nr:centriole, cilia and spindle-associated protein [Cyclopterus lumpus]